MKRTLLTLGLMLLLMPILAGTSSNPEYIVIGWNDLGMHCTNIDFSKMAVLPPYNNLRAQVIRRGDANTKPAIVTTGFKITYEIPGNTYSAGKTNFWDYAKKLFGVDLEKDIGLKGNGMKGNMSSTSNYFYVEGIPITPYTDDDLKNEDPYQLALLKVYDSKNNLVASTKPVIPVSGEIGCVNSGCHKSEQAILDKHEKEKGFNPNNKPILCASCHSSNALGTKGIKGVKSLSFVIHDKHSDKTKDCYSCHPGQNTKCFRDVMYSAGMTCKNCHGTMKDVAKSIEKGRQPWLNEPSCGSSKCHGSNFGEEKGKLFRESKGHGGLYCSACHGSPHAILPTVNSRDNAQNIALQGYKGILDKCSVCHGVTPDKPGPHNIKPTKVKLVAETNANISTLLKQNYPNPAKQITNIPFSIAEDGYVMIEIFDINGKQLLSIVNQFLKMGEYTVPLDVSKFNNGVYIYKLSFAGHSYSNRFLVSN